MEVRHEEEALSAKWTRRSGSLPEIPPIWVPHRVENDIPGRTQSLASVIPVGAKWADPILFFLLRKYRFIVWECRQAASTTLLKILALEELVKPPILGGGC